LSESVVSKEQEEKLLESKDPNAIGRIQRQGRWKGVDPVLFLKDEKIINSLVEFYGIRETFPVHQHLVVRSEDVTRCKRIYYVSASVANTIQQNFRAGEQMKITSAGLKIFVSSLAILLVQC
jgi:multisite-specific tRNA:(cytosine-C5)-methyltransferase